MSPRKAATQIETKDLVFGGVTLELGEREKNDATAYHEESEKDFIIKIPLGSTTLVGHEEITPDTKQHTAGLLKELIESQFRAKVSAKLYKTDNVVVITATPDNSHANRTRAPKAARAPLEAESIIYDMLDEALHGKDTLDKKNFYEFLRDMCVQRPTAASLKKTLQKYTLNIGRKNNQINADEANTMRIQDEAAAGKNLSEGALKTVRAIFKPVLQALCRNAVYVTREDGRTLVDALIDGYNEARTQAPKPGGKHAEVSAYVTKLEPFIIQIAQNIDNPDKLASDLKIEIGKALSAARNQSLAG